MKRLLAIAVFVLMAHQALAQTVMPMPKVQFFTNTGAVCNGCKLYSYIAGTSTPADTFTIPALTVGFENANPVVLDSSGRASIFLSIGSSYKFTLTTSGGTQIWSVDNIQASYSLVTATGNTSFTGSLLWTTSGTIGLATHLTSPARIFLTTPAITPASGSGISLDNLGEVRQEIYKMTVTSANVITAGVTHDLVIGTLPAKTFITHILADVSTAFACTGTCTSSTLSATVGTTAGGNDYLVSFDLDAAAARFGDATAELGSLLTEATIATPIGALGSWSSTQAINLRITSGTGNLGTGTATNLSQGSVTFYITTIKFP